MQTEAQSLLPSSFEAPAWLDNAAWPAEEVIAARNGLIHLQSFADGKEPFFREPTPQFFTTSALDFDFQPDAPEPKRWLDFVHRLWDQEECIETLQEWFGYLLTLDTRHQKILMLVGPKRSGKGTIGRVIRELVGPSNVAGPTLSGLGTNFGLWPLLGKSVAIISDARLSGRSDSAVVVERLLTISGEDAVTIDRKNMEPVTTRLTSRLMVLTNELPRLNDASGALTSRFILLPLTETWYGEEDHGLTDALVAELPGILLWAIHGWKRLQDRGYFIQPAESAEIMNELDALSSPVGTFIRDCCVTGPEYRALMDDLYAEWKQWCEERGVHESTQQILGRDLRAAIPTLKDWQPRLGATRRRGYVGIGLARTGTRGNPEAASREF